MPGKKKSLFKEGDLVQLNELGRIKIGTNPYVDFNGILEVKKTNAGNLVVYDNANFSLLHIQTDLFPTWFEYVVDFDDEYI